MGVLLGARYPCNIFLIAYTQQLPAQSVVPQLGHGGPWVGFGVWGLGRSQKTNRPLQVPKVGPLEWEFPFMQGLTALFPTSPLVVRGENVDNGGEALCVIPIPGKIGTDSGIFGPLVIGWPNISEISHNLDTTLFLAVLMVGSTRIINSTLPC